MTDQATQIASLLQLGFSMTGAFTTDDLHILIAVWNSAPGVTLRVGGYMMDVCGQPTLIQQDLIPATDRSLSSMVLPLSTACLPSLDVRAVAGTPRRGQCFVRISIIKGLTANALSVGTLVQGYVQDTTVLSYPGNALEAMTSGRGVLRSIAGTNPAAGVEISETVPTNARWRVHSIRFAFVASGVAANRAPVLTIDDGATILFETGSAVLVTAGQTATYAALPGVPFFTLGTRSYHLPLPPDLELPGGSRIRTVTGALDAGDDYGAPQLQVEEWIED